jgi:hypothetical protein
MAPDQEPEPGSAPPERPGTPQPRRRGRRAGRGRRGRGQRPSLPPAQEPPPPGEEPAEPIQPVSEPALVESGIAAPPIRELQPTSPALPGQVLDQPYHAPLVREPRPASPASPASVQQAIEVVNHIIETLRGTLDDMEEVLETLELAERQQNAGEQEIETLRRGLRQLHRPREGGQHPPRH